MMSPAYPKLNKEDAAICRALRDIVKRGEFKIQGDAMPRAGSIFRWLEDLDKRIEATLESEKKTVRKSLEQQK